MKKLIKLFPPIDRPTIIVGEKMGAQRVGQDTYALEGNRTGDYVHEAIENNTNIILTNINNYYYSGNFDHSHKGVAEGILDLIELFEKYEPKKIITLGGIARDYVQSIKVIPTDCRVINLPHPSWVNRFQSKSRSIYLKQLQDEINR